MMLYSKFDYKPLERINHPSGRRYDVGSGVPLPSVTTILSKTADMTHINEWVNRVGEAKSNQIKTESSNLGTGMHQNLENYVHGIPMSGSFMSKTLAELIIKKGLSSVDEIWGMEVNLYSQNLYAGTTDMIGQWSNKKPVVIDFKNSLRLKKLEWIDDYRAQLAAYALAHNEMYDTDINQGVIMIATRDATYQEFVFEGEEFSKCVNIWLRRLEQYYNLPSEMQ